MNDQNINLKRGLLPLILMSLLKKADMYGYQLVQETGRQSQGRIITQEGSLYPVLYRLEQAGFVSERKVPAGPKMMRNYYHLEPAGEEYLNRVIEEYDFITEGIRLILGRKGTP